MALRPDKMFQMYITSFVLNNEENTSYGQQSPGLQSFWFGQIDNKAYRVSFAESVLDITSVVGD